MAARSANKGLSMEIPTYLLFALGWLGAADVTLFHSVAHGIRSHPDSVGELVTHSLRGPTYAALFVLIPNFEMHGLFACGLMGLFVIDVGISVWDFSLEQNSRRFLGGLPAGEYVLHMLMAMVFGALMVTVPCFAAHWFTAPTRLVYAPTAVPDAIRLIMFVMAILVLISGIQDAAAALRMARLSPRWTKLLPTRVAPVLGRQNAASIATTGFPLNAPVFKTQKWMRGVLTAAGIYNVFWGAWVVLFPSALFRWTGMPPSNYPQIWQCVGMIVGVYGIGYLIAARDPLRHWPIVFVGLLGKILGPIGMWWSVTHTSLSGVMAWTCLTNDLIWWGPFALVLVQVVRLSACDAANAAFPSH